MKNMLNLDKLNLNMGESSKFFVQDYAVDICFKKDVIGNLNFIIVKESNLGQDLEGYIDQLEPNDYIESKYIKIKDAQYGGALSKGNLLFIDELYITEEWRGKGNGSKVLEEVISYTKSIGVDRIVLSPQPIGLKKEHNSFNDRVLKLESWYNKYGFKTYTNNESEFKYMLLLLK